MTKFNFKNVFRLSLFDFKRRRMQIIGWSFAIFAIMFLYMILFPVVKDMAQTKMDALPKEMLTFIGMSSFSDMNNFITYFGMVFNFILIAISLFAVTLSAKLSAGEEKNATIEFLNALEISRSEIYFSKLITSLTSVFCVIFAASLSTFICAGINAGETFVFADFLKIILISGFTPFFFISVTLLIFGITAKISCAGIGSIAVLICYVLGYLGNLLQDKAEFLKYLSPFETFSPANAAASEDKTIIILGIYAALSVIFIAVGAVLYKRRDLNI